MGPRYIRSGTNSGCVKYKTFLVLALVVTQTRMLLWLFPPKAARNWVPGKEDSRTRMLKNGSTQRRLIG